MKMLLLNVLLITFVYSTFYVEEIDFSSSSSGSGSGSDDDNNNDDTSNNSPSTSTSGSDSPIHDITTLYCNKYTNENGVSCVIENKKSEGAEDNKCWGVKIVPVDKANTTYTITFDVANKIENTCTDLFIKVNDFNITAIFKNVTGYNLYKYATFQNVNKNNTLIVDTSEAITEDNMYIKFQDINGEVTNIKGKQPNIHMQIFNYDTNNAKEFKFNIKEKYDSLEGIFNGTIGKGDSSFNILSYTPLKCPELGETYDFATVPSSKLTQSIVGTNYTLGKSVCTVAKKENETEAITTFYLETLEVKNDNSTDPSGNSTNPDNNSTDTSGDSKIPNNNNESSSSSIRESVILGIILALFVVLI